jgi:hypothetical protein
MKVLAWIFLLLPGLSFSAAAAERCGQTKCPSGYKNLFCYDAGETSRRGVTFIAKICTVEPEGGVLTVQGDLLVTAEFEGEPFGTSSWNVNIADCQASFYGSDGLLSYRTGGITFELGHLRRTRYRLERVYADHYIMTPQLKAVDRTAFRQPSNVRVTRCEFRSIDEN